MANRDLDSDLALEVAKSALSPIILVEIGTADAGAPVRAWSGIGELVWDGKTFQGTGIFGKITPVEETTELKASGVTFELSGVPSELLSISLSQIRQGREAKIWLGALNGRALIGTPYLLSRNLTDVPEIEDNGETVTIRITAENRLIDLERPRVRRFTTEDQKRTDATDVGFEYVPGLQDAQIVWGRA